MVKSKMETQDVCEKYAKPWRFEMMRIIMIVGLLALISFTSVSAIIINVPGDSATIQGGINGASDGDTVLIYPGTYFENVNFNGTNLILGSLFLIAGDTSYISSTIIDGSSSGSVIMAVLKWPKGRYSRPPERAGFFLLFRLKIF